MGLYARQTTIESLRQAIRSIEGQRITSASFVSTGRPRVDGLLPGGGLPRGVISELAGGRASGKTAVALSALASTMGEDGLAAFVDGRHELYPPAAASAGIALDRLLIVRPSAGAEDVLEACKSGLWAAEALLTSGGFRGVAVDVPIEVLGRHHGAAAMLDTMLRRVRAAAEKGGALALWLSAENGPRIPSAVRLEFSTTEAGWRVHRAHARTPSGVAEHERPATSVVPHAA
jgi:protein ImuA